MFHIDVTMASSVNVLQRYFSAVFGPDVISESRIIDWVVSGKEEKIDECVKKAQQWLNYNQKLYKLGRLDAKMLQNLRAAAIKQIESTGFDVSNLSPSTNPPDSTPELARSTPELAPRHDPFRRPDNTPQLSPRRDPPLPPKNTPIPSPQLSPRSTENMRQQIFSQGYTQNPFFVQM